jgi:signal transduction histidine kinase
MTTEGQSVANTLLQRLGNRGVWSVSFLLFVAPFYALASIAFDAFRVNNFSIQWVLIGLLTFAEMVLLAATVRLVIPRSVWRSKTAPLTNFVIAATIGAIKNMTVAWLAVYTGLESEVDWCLRGIGGALMLTFLLLAYVPFSGSRLEHLERIESLQKVRRELLGLRKNADAEVEAQINELIFETRKTLEPKLDQIEKLLTNAGSTENAVEQLRDLIRNHIRPYSLELQSQRTKLISGQGFAGGDIANKPRRTFWPAEFSIRQATTPFWNGIYVAVSEISVVYALFGSSKIPNAVLPSLILGLLLALINQTPASKKLIQRRNALITLVLVAIFSAVLSCLALSFILDLENYFLLILVSYSTIATGILLGIAMIRLLALQRDSLEQRVAQVNQELELELKLFEQALWLNRTRWSYALHGSVQARLTAAITRLTQSGSEDAAVIEIVKRDLDHVRETISKPVAKQANLKQEFSEISQTWRGICNVRFDVAKSASELLAKSPSTSMCVNEIVKEAVSNARRHGSAQNVLVKIQKGATDLIEVKITNDGEPMESLDSNSPKDQLGLGLKMYDELSLRWRIRSDRVSRSTQLEIELPVIAD